MTVTFACPDLGFIGSLEPEATVTLLSKVNSKLLDEVIAVPSVKVLGLSALLKIVTVPFALSPVSFFPVVSIVAFPSCVSVTNFPEISLFETSVEPFVKVIFSDFVESYCPETLFKEVEEKNIPNEKEVLLKKLVDLHRQ